MPDLTSNSAAGPDLDRIQLGDTQALRDAINLLYRMQLEEQRIRANADRYLEGVLPSWLTMIGGI